MTRMNLDQLVTFLRTQDLSATANYFQGCNNDTVTVDGLIEQEFVKRHVGEGMVWREIQTNVTSYMFLETNAL